MITEIKASIIKQKQKYRVFAMKIKEKSKIFECDEINEIAQIIKLNESFYEIQIFTLDYPASH